MFTEKMDVDLLRPGTVPISKDTFLWFEFLLNPNLLEEHLKKTKPDPSPTELIIKFLTISTEQSTGREPEIIVEIGDSEKPKEIVKPQSTKLNKRSRALKILALKIAAYLNWDLSILESKLPFSIQLLLFQDLLRFTNDNYIDPATHYDIDFNNEPDHVLFALSLYHRWVLRAVIDNGLSFKLRPGVQESGGLIMPPVSEDTLSHLEENAERSASSVLSGIITYKEQNHTGHHVIPSFETFVSLIEDSSEDETPRWHLGVQTTNSEFLIMILTDLSSYLFFREDYSGARFIIEKCKKEFEKWQDVDEKDSGRFCKTSLETINGYLIACQPPSKSSIMSLTEKFHLSVRENYEGILSILVEDNTRREIPMCYRDCLELDIASALSSRTFTATRDLLFQIQSLNTVLKRATENVCFYDYAEKLMHARRGVEIFLWALKPFISGNEIGWSEKQKDELERLRLFVLDLIESCDPSTAREISESDVIKNFISPQDIAESLSILPVKIPMPPEAQIQFVTPDFSNMQLRVAKLEKKLLTSNDPHVIKDIIIKLVEMNAMRPPWHINYKWELGNPMHSAVQNLPAGVVCSFMYVILGKARLYDQLQKYECALHLLEVAAQEAALHQINVMMKVAALIDWEIVFVKSHFLHTDWHNRARVQIIDSLLPRCLIMFEVADLPRPEILEQGALTLLNLGQWDVLTSGMCTDKRLNLPICELASGLAYACQDIVKFKGNKKVSRDAWDLMVPVFGHMGNLQKRGGGGPGGGMHQDSPSLLSSINHYLILQFISQLRDVSVLTCCIALLARLHNVLRDEVNLELIVEQTALWPGVVSNANSYNTQLVSETLLQLVNQALHYYPKNISWMKLLGDIHFVNGQYAGALKYYILAITTASDHFSRPLVKTVIEDYVYKRMIKCLTQLQCHVQAAVMCQFLEEIDYHTAFKCLAEPMCSDALDTHYSCFWDINILEYLIYLQTKRNNKDRVKKAIDMIGLLELNSNNNDEIKREAANKRKTKFLYALAKQYLL